MTNIDEVRASAPGRVNLIGDHTDYSGGLVLPMVIDCETTITGTWTEEPCWTIASDDMPESAVISVPIGDPAAVQPGWARYVAGVVAEFETRGTKVPGFRGRIRTTIPIGSGLSSSAALEVAVAKIIMQASPDSMAPTDIARLCQRAERQATGVPCGIMDQLSIVSGRRGAATLIDCHDLSIEYVDIPDDIEFDIRFVHDRALADSAYSERVAQCTAVEELIGPLRSANIGDLTRITSEVLQRRARHVVSENQRVRDFAAALRSTDYSVAGDLMTTSHWSMARDYETSTPDMDRAVETALGEPGVLGARMTGGGFGGCIVVMRTR
ncbi:MAG: galactokinase [Ilumatobacteraceae bacterium]